MSCTWKKTENEAGYPCYVETLSNRQEFDHPLFQSINENLRHYDEIKYCAYRTAFKISCLQNQLKVPPLRISSGVLARHRLSLSESSLSLEAAELEAVLADIYFAAEKEGLFAGDVDLAVDLLLNLLLNVYDRERKEPVRVLATKTLLILLSEESCMDKWTALANCAADHNGCVSPRRLITLLSHIAALPSYLSEKNCEQHLQEDIDSCFTKSAGMLGLNAKSVAEWAVDGCASARWLPILSRIQSSRTHPCVSNSCSACGQTIAQVLRFKCAKCTDMYFCEKCYLYDTDLNVNGHKKTHLVQEIINGEIPRSECLGFMSGVKKLFFCTKVKRKKTSKKKGNKKKKEAIGSSQHERERKEGKPAIFTSTVGKASGNTVNNPAVMLQDIITQLEMQNKALKELSGQLEIVSEDANDNVKLRVDSHWGQIATQISRLKIVKDNLTLASQTQVASTDKNIDKGNKERIQPFDFFSPIPILQEEKPKASENLKSQPRVLSLDSGNFSVVSKQTVDGPLMTMSGDALKPVVVHSTSDSISTVSMNDISLWYNDGESLAPKLRQPGHSKLEPEVQYEESSARSHSLCVTEERFDADLRSVASSNDKMKELNADLDTVLDRLQQILTNNFAMDDCLDNSQLRETANEMEGLLGTLIRGVEQRATLSAAKGTV